VNTVLNHYANSLGFDYDDKGMISRSGNCYPDLLEQLNALPFYQKNYPKSLGFEFVKVYFDQKATIRRQIILKHIAIQIAASLPSKGKLLITVADIMIF
jgi:anhydro-N-acetylmuramic acid kinase